MDARLLPLKRRAAIEPVIAQVGWHVAISPTGDGHERREPVLARASCKAIRNLHQTFEQFAEELTDAPSCNLNQRRLIHNKPPL
jgi:hypothetical protein